MREPGEDRFRDRATRSQAHVENIRRLVKQLCGLNVKKQVANFEMKSLNKLESNSALVWLIFLRREDWFLILPTFQFSNLK